VKLNEQGATIIYTSHYMEEVEQICDYIVIMDKGEVIRHGTNESLKGSITLGEIIKIQVLDPKPEYPRMMKQIPNVIDAFYKDEMLIVKSGKGKTNIPNVITVMTQHEIRYGTMYSSVPTLNDVFLEITGKELRD
jgi:ABC-2 type transport system ATP-binding protein